jgi:hypothetical protein
MQATELQCNASPAAMSAVAESADNCLRGCCLSHSSSCLTVPAMRECTGSRSSGGTRHAAARHSPCSQLKRHIHAGWTAWELRQRCFAWLQSKHVHMYIKLAHKYGAQSIICLLAVWTEAGTRNGSAKASVCYGTQAKAGTRVQLTMPKWALPDNLVTFVRLMAFTLAIQCKI